MCLRETTTLSGSSRNRYLLATTSYRSTSPERCGLGSPPSPRRCSEKALDPRHAPESATRYVHYMYLIARNTLSGLLEYFKTSVLGMLCAYWKHIPWVARWKAATARSTCMQLQWRPRDRPGVFYLQPGSNGWSTMALRRSGSLQTPFLTSAVPDRPTSPLDFAFEEWATKSCRQIFGVREHVTSAYGSPQHAPARVREESTFGRYVWCGVVHQHNKYIKVRYM